MLAEELAEDQPVVKASLLLLHAISRQDVHQSSYPQVTVLARAWRGGNRQALLSRLRGP